MHFHGLKTSRATSNLCVVLGHTEGTWTAVAPKLDRLESISSPLAVMQISGLLKNSNSSAVRHTVLARPERKRWIFSTARPRDGRTTSYELIFMTTTVRKSVINFLSFLQRGR